MVADLSSHILPSSIGDTACVVCLRVPLKIKIIAASHLVEQTINH